MREDAQQRDDALRELLDGVRYVVTTGCQWRYLPHDFPPWSAVYQQARRCWKARCFEDISGPMRQFRAMALDSLLFKNCNAEVQAVIRIVFAYMQESMDAPEV